MGEIWRKIEALGGALLRARDGWEWADGEPEPRVRDMTLQDLAPAFRCITGVRTEVEIPHDWAQAQYWPAGQVDPDALAAIRGMLSDGSGRPAPIYAEGLAEAIDDHRLSKHGYLVPIEVWDAVMGQIAGVWWDKKDEAAILARAESLRLRGASGSTGP